MTIQDTSEVNPVDFFVAKKIPLTELVYKLMCGAIVTVIALRLNDIIKTLITSVSMLMPKNNEIVNSLLDLMLTLIFVVVFAMIMRVVMFSKLSEKW
jgi:hypothetical protein